MQKKIILNTFILFLMMVTTIQAQKTKADSTNNVVEVKQLDSPKKKEKKVKAKKTKSPKPKKVAKTKSPKKEKTKKEKPAKVVKTKTPKKKNKKEKKSIAKTASKPIEEELLVESMSIDEPTEETEGLKHPSEIDNCEFAFNVVDEFTGKKKRGLKERLFFTYTPGSYKKFLKDQDFLTCTGYLTESSDGLMALHLKFKVLSKTAKSKFGVIAPNSTMLIFPMRGKPISLQSFKGGAAQIFDDYTLYEATFAINKSDLNTLKKTEVDQVRITWSGGFQVYDIYYLDFLIDQFPCFEDVK
ncbi:MAG: hypothetical protein GY810_27700 [Aureispira sp.]|nr:hypothetical protein [Aureispira sp.]